MATRVKRAAKAADLTNQLVALMTRLMPGSLEEPSRDEFIAIFRRLLGLAYHKSQNMARRSQLCHDGTPVEMSIAWDNQYRFETRAVCDVAGGLPDVDDRDVPAQLRAVTDTIVPNFRGRNELLDAIFERQLAKRSPASRFLMWHGVGASPGKPLLTKLYFNAEWLSGDALVDVLTPLLPSHAVDRCISLPGLVGSRHKCLAYDLSAEGLSKIKLYTEPAASTSTELFSLLDGFPAHEAARLQELLRLCIADLPESSGCFVLVLGMLPGQGRTDFAFEPKVYLHLKSWGVPGFAGVGPVIGKLMHRWGFEVPEVGFGAGPSHLEPTLLSIGASRAREGVALYFKPAAGSMMAYPSS
jgi:hypothetical protein